MCWHSLSLILEFSFSSSFLSFLSHTLTRMTESNVVMIFCTILALIKQHNSTADRWTKIESKWFRCVWQLCKVFPLFILSLARFNYFAYMILISEFWRFHCCLRSVFSIWFNAESESSVWEKHGINMKMQQHYWRLRYFLGGSLTNADYFRVLPHHGWYPTLSSCQSVRPT